MLFCSYLKLSLKIVCVCYKYMKNIYIELLLMVFLILHCLLLLKVLVNMLRYKKQ